MSLKLYNLSYPNPVKNTLVFYAFDAEDSFFNLNVALKEYKEQFHDLQELKWQCV